MPNDVTVEQALKANLESANKALDTYLESVINPKTYHALHDSALAAKAALEGYHQQQLEMEEAPPVIGEKYRDAVGRILRRGLDD